MDDDAKVLRLGILHYHLLRGGVQTVLVNTIRALLQYGNYDSLEIDLISGDAQQSTGRDLIQQLLDEAGAMAAKTELSIRPIEILELAYDDHPAANKQKFLKESHLIAEKLYHTLHLPHGYSEYPYLLHAHNMNLGKNPRATCALKLLADCLEHQNIPAWILYQMHDFAENQRPACWGALKNCTGQPDSAFAVEIMYPTSRRVLWACLNSANRNQLLSIGIPAERIYILPNAIDTTLFTAPPIQSLTADTLQELKIRPAKFSAQIKQRIADYANRNGFTFSPAHKILLAPIQALRRKNIAESILLTLSRNHKKDPWQLLVTLPAHTGDDLEYCAAIEQFVKEHHLPVVLGFGDDLLNGHSRLIRSGRVEKFSLIDLMAISQAVLTTSLQEGFGYVFHEPWLAGKAVLGRNIPRLTCDFTAAGMHLGHLYDHLLFPIEWLGPLEKSIKAAWLDKLNTNRKMVDLAYMSPKYLSDAMERDKIFRLRNGSLLDFADLDLDAQLYILKLLIETPPLTGKLLCTDSENRLLPGWYPAEVSDIIEHNRQVVAGKYSLAALAENYGSLIKQGKRIRAGTNQLPPARYLGNETVFASALEPKNLRLLV